MPPIQTFASDAAAVTSHRFSPKLAVAIVYVIALFMSAMDNHIVNVMLPTLARTFHTSLLGVQWTRISYILSLAVFIPCSGWISDRVGNKRVFLLALCLFTAASAACGQAHTLTELITFRFIQGAGGGMLTPVGTTMLYRAYPPAERARMTRILLAPTLLGPVLAQPVGGLLVTKVSWRWCFYLNVGPGIAAVIIGLFYLTEYREPIARKLDTKGFVLSAAGLSSLLYALSEGTQKGWTSVDILVTMFVGIASLWAFVIVERRQEHPMLNIRLLSSDRLFRATNLVTFLNGIGFSGLLFLGPTFLQLAKGQSALDSGLTTFCVALGVMAASQSVARLYVRVGPRRLSVGSSASLVLMLSSFVLIGFGTNLWYVRLAMFLAGFSNGGNAMALRASMFTTISKEETASGSAILNTLQQTATALSVVILTTVFSTASKNAIVAFHFAFLTAAGFVVLGCVASYLLIHDSDAAATMVAAKPASSPATEEEATRLASRD